MKYQENEGLLSSLVRDIRLSQVAAHIRENSVVLDLACGAGYLKAHLPRGCVYYGVDRLSILPQEQPSSVMALDLLEEGAVTQIQRQFGIKPDYITCIAFLEHIFDPKAFVAGYSSLLSNKGVFMGTTPHPRGRAIHDVLSRIRLLSREAAREHVRFLGKSDIVEMAAASGGKLSVYREFLFGLNQFFVIEYGDRQDRMAGG